MTAALPTVNAKPELATATGGTVRTRLTDALEIEHPVMLAGMGGVSYHQLVAAVSEAGGFGCLGASAMSQDEMVEEIRAVKAATSKPFGVDLLTAVPQDMPAQVRKICPCHEGRDQRDADS